MSGTPTGYASAAVNAGKLAAGNNAFGPNSSGAQTGLGYAGNLLGAYQGFSTGGIAGNAQGALNVAEIGAKAGAFGSAADSTILSKAPIIGDALSVYNTVKNWQSGNTGSDALNGAETGATIGSSFGPIGALAGGVIGGAVGAISSAFGGGEKDPETTNFNNLVAQNAKTGNDALIGQLNPSQAYQSLAGMMDAKNNSAGHSTQLELAFGRMGEGALMTQMTTQINNAIASGQISKTATPSQIYSQVVTPWLQSKNAYVPADQIISSNGTKAGNTVNDLLTQLIGQWQSGSLTSGSQVGVSGQTIAGLPAYAGAAAPATTNASSTMSNLGYNPMPVADRGGLGGLGYEEL